ncbi:L-alanine exporter AlaE [Agrobacterium radiobacter]|uniref:L-alanine exporter AlaE n=1 Tax=Agrobacterium radiobacter TaxID=362 RepID=UPI0028937389|nr:MULTISPECIES: L-alanine exporter AlaE [Agrobacterium tumefaciens complex]
MDREVTITQSPSKFANTQPGTDAREAHLPDRSTRRRSFLADTVALLIFFTATGALNERFIAGMSWEEVCNARLLGAVLMVPVARPYGLWRDWMMKRAGEATMSQLFWDSLSLMTFQVPIYAAIIAISGAEGGGLLSGILGAAVMMLVLGRPYGAFLNTVRRLFGLPKGGSKTMSFNTETGSP